MFARTISKFLCSLIILWAAASSVFPGPVIVSGGVHNDYESWIERLGDGRLMIIFDRNPDWASGDLYATFSDDGGASWTSPLEIIGDAGDQATLSFAILPSDTIRLWYASNESGTYRIHSAWSINGVDWTREGETNLGWSAGTMYYDPTVALEPDGSLTMSYVVSGQGVFVAHQPVGGAWDTDCTQVSSSGYRPRVMKHSDGTYLYVYHKRTGGSYDYDVFVTASSDRVTWSTPIRLTTNLNSHDPFVCETSDGAYLVYYAKYQAPAYNIHCRRSYDGLSWEPETPVMMDASSNTQPHALVENDRIHLVWAHEISSSDHDVYFDLLEYVPAPCCSLRGDVDNNEVGPDIADLVFLVNYMFSGGQEPPCTDHADIDGNLVGPDIADLVFLVNYMFSGGPAPAPCK